MLEYYYKCCNRIGHSTRSPAVPRWIGCTCENNNFLVHFLTKCFVVRVFLCSASDSWREIMDMIKYSSLRSLAICIHTVTMLCMVNFTTANIHNLHEHTQWRRQGGGKGGLSPSNELKDHPCERMKSEKKWRGAAMTMCNNQK